ncbi:MAG: geranylgeranylglycerol-phosphate geranylgeranyltransferase [Cyclobacteriaceae bacterium]
MIRLIKYDFVGFLIASRIPNLLIIGSTQYLTAIFLVSDFQGKRQILTSSDFLFLVASTLAIAAGGYIINDYYDQKVDMINRPNKVVVGTLFRRRLAMAAHFFLTFAGIMLGFIVKIEVGLVHLFSSFFLWYYSNYLQRLPVIGNLVVAFMSGLALLLVPIFLGRNEPIVYIYAIFAMCVILVREVIKDIEDVKGDATFGFHSVPVVWGVRGAKFFIYLVIIGSGFFLLSFLVVIDNWLVRYYFMALLPLFVWFIFRLAKADRKSEFERLRNFTNIIIFTGLISMLII